MTPASRGCGESFEVAGSALGGSFAVVDVDDGMVVVDVGAGLALGSGLAE